ncbi:MAG TPA: alpha-L-fucosidase [Bryobacteraceae bacterium]|nr:alpha-L-fucosidase [Bryobacteraceae bacterium]
MLTKTVITVLLGVAALAAQPSGKPLPEAQRTRWFQEAKFGMFLHWGPYSVIGRHEWARHRFQIPQEQYDTYARRFNPERFNPDAWVDLAANAGAKYMVITSKHHDGFDIWRSKVGDYDMEITPYKGDPLKMLAEASKRKGMRLGFYHSIMDWHHPDYRPLRDWESDKPKEGGNLNRYIDYMKAQLQELLTGYGDVAMIWFDGEWEHSTKEMRSDEVYDFIRKLQPNALINDRLYKREPGNRADFGTPEQFVPATGMRDPSGKPILWEACVTINQDSWGYNKYETQFKTERGLIRMLVEVVSKGGNLLLNVGPKPDGTIQDEFVTRLNAMGRWVKVNGEAIYGTTASPFTTLPFFGRATTKGNTVYLHVFQWPADGRLPVPTLKNKVRSARLVGRPGQKLVISAEGGQVVVAVPREAPDEIASVVALELDGPPQAEPYVTRPDASGVFTLRAEAAEIQSSLGQRAKFENALGRVFLTSWNRKGDVPVWSVDIPRAGRYKVELSYAANGGGTPFTIATQSGKLESKAANTRGEWVFRTHPAGEIDMAAGPQSIRLEADIRGSAEAMNLEKITFTPVR